MKSRLTNPCIGEGKSDLNVRRVPPDASGGANSFIPAWPLVDMGPAGPTRRPPEGHTMTRHLDRLFVPVFLAALLAGCATPRPSSLDPLEPEPEMLDGDAALMLLSAG